MTSLAMYGAGGTALIAAVVKLRSARRDLNPGVLYLCGTLACVGLAAPLSAPATITLAIPIEPFGNATRLLAHTFGMIAAYCVYGLLIRLVMPPAAAQRRMRQQLGLLVAAVSGMTLLLIIANLPTETAFVDRHSDHPVIVGYLTLFAGYIAVSILGFLRLSVPAIRDKTNAWLHTGLLVISLGASLCLGWAAWKLIGAWTTFLTRDAVHLGPAPSTMFSVSGILLIALGFTLRTWGPTLAAPFRWFHRWCCYRTIRPLWTDLCSAVPHIHLSTPSKPTLDFTLYRQVIEIRDARLALRPHMSPHIPSLAQDNAQHRTTGADTDAAEIEAALLANAIRERHQGTRYDRTSNTSPGHHATTLDDEVRWLVRVSRAYARSSLVQQLHTNTP